jgi:nitrate/nitrite-specific signal transduction histidine kinase
MGIDPAALDQGKQGNFRLQGMHERAARIGGTFTLTASSNAGTEIKTCRTWQDHLSDAKANSSDSTGKATRFRLTDNPKT